MKFETEGDDRRAENRDTEREIESRYNIPAEYQSVLAYVDAERDELVPEFWRWRSASWGGDLGPAVREWERIKFGAELYYSAHGVLMFVILASLAPGERPRRYGNIKAGLSNQQRKERLDDALDALTTKRMPSAFKGDGEHAVALE